MYLLKTVKERIANLHSVKDWNQKVFVVLLRNQNFLIYRFSRQEQYISPLILEKMG